MQEAERALENPKVRKMFEDEARREAEEDRKEMVTRYLCMTKPGDPNRKARRKRQKEARRAQRVK